MFRGSNESPSLLITIAILGLFLAGDGSAQECIDYGGRPAWLGTVPTPGSAVAVTVAGDYAYVAGFSAGLQIIDISDPGAPEIVGANDALDAAQDVAISGNYAYVVDRYTGLHVVDVSDHTNPQVIGSVATLSQALGIVLASPLAYVTDMTGLLVIDVGDPSHPQIIGNVETPSSAKAAVVVNDLAYVAAGYSGLQVIDISNPADPQIIGSASIGGDARDVSVIGDRAYVAAGRLQIYSVANPENPYGLQEFYMPETTHCVTAVGKSVYAAGAGGTHVVDVSDLENVYITASLTAPTIAFDLALEPTAATTDRAYIASLTSGLWIANLQVPQAVGSVNLPDAARDMIIDGTLTYATTYDSGLEIISTADPRNPQLLATVALGGTARGLDVAQGYTGYYAYAASGGIIIINIDHPYYPYVAGEVETANSARDVKVRSHRAYIANNTGFQVINVANIYSPWVMATIDTPGSNNHAIELTGDHAYIAADDDGLVIVDVTDPFVPFVLSLVSLPGTAMHVVVAGNYAFVAAGQGGLQLVDVSEPAAPIITGSIATPGSARQVAVTEQQVYVADDDGGFLIVNIHDPASPQIMGGLMTPTNAISIAGESSNIQLGCNGTYTVASSLLVFPFQCNSRIVSTFTDEFGNQEREVPTLSTTLAAYPNPFNPQTRISFALEQAGAAEISVHALNGRRVFTLADREFGPGRHSLDWTGRDEQGRNLPSGIYLLRLKTHDSVQSHKLSLIR